MKQTNLFPADPILLVDDEGVAIELAKLVLRQSGITNLVGCQDSLQVMDLFADCQFAAVLLDLGMPGLSGKELLARIVEQYPQTPVIIITGTNEVEVAVSCIKAGAFDFLVKPVEHQRMISVVRHALELRDASAEHLAFRERVLRDELSHPEAFAGIITRDQKMRAIFQYAEAIAPTAKPVLITGETGVGKELIARAIHTLSGRQGPFLAVNVAGLDDHVFADTLFGHVRGAFTGADRSRAGLVEKAAGGTLFLDEIGDLSHSSQVKLLRLFQEREYLPLGEDVSKKADARMLVATNRDVVALRDQGLFRVDLYYRLQSHHVHIPPLRERLADLPLLIDHFLDRARPGERPVAAPGLCSHLAAYAFPGNIRELEGMVSDAVMRLQEGPLRLGDFVLQPGQAWRPSPASALNNSPYAGLDQLPTLKEAQQLLFAEALQRAKGNQAVAARLVGLTRSGLNKALKRQGSRG